MKHWNGLSVRAQCETTTAELYWGASELWSLDDTGLPPGSRLKSEMWPVGRPGLANAPAHLAQANSRSQCGQAWTRNHWKGSGVSARLHDSWLDCWESAPDVLIIFCLWYEIHHRRRIFQGKVFMKGIWRPSTNCTINWCFYLPPALDFSHQCLLNIIH